VVAELSRRLELELHIGAVSVVSFVFLVMHPVLHTHYYKRPYNGTLDLVTKCLLRMDIDVYPWSFFDDLTIYDSECHGAGALLETRMA